MKKTAILLAAVLAFALLLTACSGTGTPASESPSASTETSEGASAETSESASAETSEETSASTEASSESAAAGGELETITVGASPTPHAEILAQIEKALEDKGYKLEVVEFTDYIQPNVALDGEELDANYFQHITYLNNYNEQNGTNLANAAGIHYEPFGIYPGKTATLDALADGAQIAVPNDPTNEARALLLLQQEGLITLDENAGLEATVLDIKDNPKNLDIVEVEAAQLARSLPDVDAAVINGNYAIQAGLSPLTDAIATEAQDSDTAVAYTNVVAVRSGTENDPKIQALVEALQTPEVAQFMEDTYGGAVVAVF